MPIVSVIVPVYNAQNHIEKCLESIKNQIFSDFEVIMIDDGSTDLSATVCKEFSERDNRFKYFFQENSGPDMARKSGTGFAEGKYVVFVDSDDYISDKLLLHLIEASEQYKADVVCSQIIRVSGDKQWDSTAHMDDVQIYEDVASAMKAYFVDGYLVGSYVAKLIDADLMKKYDFVKNSIIGEDISGILYLINHATKIAVIPEVDYFYYWNQSSISHSGYTPRHKESLKNYIKVRNEVLKSQLLEERYVCGYFAGFEMATATAMSRNKVYDKEAVALLKNDIKSNWTSIKQSDKLAFYMKICMCIYMFSPKMFMFLYRIVYLVTGR